MRWREQVNELLYDTEMIRQTVELDTAHVVVTNRRILAFTPDMEGANFTQADRPNVNGVESGNLADRSRLSRGVQYVLTGLFLLGASLVIDFESAFGSLGFDTGSADAIGAGGFLSAVEQFFTLLIWLGRLLTVIGGVAAVVGIVLLAFYWESRTPTLRLVVAGDQPDITLPHPKNDGTARDRLEAALFSGTSAGGS